MHVPATGSRRVFALLLTAMLVAMSGFGPVFATTGQDEREPPPFSLYATVYPTSEIRPLDPMTLESLDEPEPLDFLHQWANISTSADGSTFVSLDYASGEIVIQDGVYGPERLRIPWDAELFDPRLSEDGSRVVLRGQVRCGPSGCGDQIWYTYDTTTGELISTVRWSGDLAWPNLVDPTATRLYLPFPEKPDEATPTAPAPETPRGPWPLGIAAFDLATGEERSRVSVPDVMIGNWQEGMIDQVPVMQGIQPAIALSPDGDRLAIVDAEGESFTIVDAETLAIDAVHEIHEPVSVLHYVLQGLGLAPQVAHAKAAGGTTRNATFAPDGQSLYITGHTIDVGDTIEDISGEGFGLLRIDTANGEITGKALPGEDLVNVLPSPDGQSIYLLDPRTDWWDDRTGSDQVHILRRLDAETLDLAAERELPQYQLVTILVTGPDAGE